MEDEDNEDAYEDDFSAEEDVQGDSKDAPSSVQPSGGGSAADFWASQMQQGSAGPDSAARGEGKLDSRTKASALDANVGPEVGNRIEKPPSAPQRPMMVEGGDLFPKTPDSKGADGLFFGGRPDDSSSEDEEDHPPPRVTPVRSAHARDAAASATNETGIRKPPSPPQRPMLVSGDLFPDRPSEHNSQLRKPSGGRSARKHRSSGGGGSPFGGRPDLGDSSSDEEEVEAKKSHLGSGSAMANKAGGKGGSEGRRSDGENLGNVLDGEWATVYRGAQESPPQKARARDTKNVSRSSPDVERRRSNTGRSNDARKLPRKGRRRQRPRRDEGSPMFSPLGMPPSPDDFSPSPDSSPRARDPSWSGSGSSRSGGGGVATGAARSYRSGKKLSPQPSEQHSYRTRNAGGAHHRHQHGRLPGIEAAAGGDHLGSYGAGSQRQGRGRRRSRNSGATRSQKSYVGQYDQIQSSYQQRPPPRRVNGRGKGGGRSWSDRSAVQMDHSIYTSQDTGVGVGACMACPR